MDDATGPSTNAAAKYAIGSLDLVTSFDLPREFMVVSLMKGRASCTRPHISRGVRREPIKSHDVFTNPCRHFTTRGSTGRSRSLSAARFDHTTAANAVSAG